MVLHKLVRRNYGGKLQASIKYQNLHCLTFELLDKKELFVEHLKMTFCSSY